MLADKHLLVTRKLTLWPTTVSLISFIKEGRNLVQISVHVIYTVRTCEPLTTTQMVLSNIWQLDTSLIQGRMLSAKRQNNWYFIIRAVWRWGFIIGGSRHKDHFCSDKSSVATNTYFWRQNTSFVATKECLARQNTCLSRQAYFRHDKRRVLSREKRVCRDKDDTCGSSRQWYTSVATKDVLTKMVLAAVPANDRFPATIRVRYTFCGT